VTTPPSTLVGCYPGSFNPATIAHVAVAEAAFQQCGLSRVDLVLSEAALGKLDVAGPSVIERAESLRRLLADRPWIGIVVTQHQLLTDVAMGYDVLVMGTDKWIQINEDGWYDSAEHKAAALAALPRLAVAPRNVTARNPSPESELNAPDLPPDAITLTVSRQLLGVSSTGVRAGRAEWQA
jgi:nicotinic acid mononucleotide adenylyltransferase